MLAQTHNKDEVMTSPRESFWTKTEHYKNVWGQPMPQIVTKGTGLQVIDDDAPPDQLAPLLQSVWPRGENLTLDIEFIKTAKTYDCEGWPMAEQLSPTVTEFDDYPLLYDAIMAAHGSQSVDCVYIHGGPGIGKSCSLAYILLRAVSQGKTIVVCYQQVATLFCEDGIYDHHFGSSLTKAEIDFWHSPQRVQNNTLVLLDAERAGASTVAQAFFTGPTGPKKWFIIYASSPQPMKTKWLVDRISFRFVMQPPSWRELVAA